MAGAPCQSGCVSSGLLDDEPVVDKFCISHRRGSDAFCDERAIHICDCADDGGISSLEESASESG